MLTNHTICGKIALLFYILGHALILSNLIFPALGRFYFGAAQSLSLRYQSSSVIGLVLILLGIFILLLSIKSSKVLIAIFMLIWFTSSAIMWFNYDDYTEVGRMNICLINKETAWQKERVDQHISKSRKWLDAPTFAPSLVHGFSSKDLVKIMKTTQKRAIW